MISLAMILWLVSIPYFLIVGLGLYGFATLGDKR